MKNNTQKLILIFTLIISIKIIAQNDVKKMIKLKILFKIKVNIQFHLVNTKIEMNNVQKSKMSTMFLKLDQVVMIKE